MSGLHKGQRQAFRAALRGLRWLLSNDARSRGFDVGRITNPIDVGVGTQCPLTQAAGDVNTSPTAYSPYADALELAGQEYGGEWAVRHGFAAPEDDAEYGYHDLTDAWVTLIAAHGEMVGT